MQPKEAQSYQKLARDLPREQFSQGGGTVQLFFEVDFHFYWPGVLGQLVEIRAAKCLCHDGWGWNRARGGCRSIGAVWVEPGAAVGRGIGGVAGLVGSVSLADVVNGGAVGDDGSRGSDAPRAAQMTRRSKRAFQPGRPPRREPRRGVPRHGGRDWPRRSRPTADRPKGST